MVNKSSTEVFFVAQVLRQGLAQDAAEATTWFRRSKAWRLSSEQAVREFRRALAENAADWSATAPSNTELVQARAALRLLVAAFDSEEARNSGRCPDEAEALAAADLVLSLPIRH